MNKKKIALGIGVIGIIGMSTVSPAAYAAGTSENNDSSQTTEFRRDRINNQSKKHSWQIGQTGFNPENTPKMKCNLKNSDCPIKQHGPMGGHRGFGPKMLSDRETMNNILENQDFETFVNLIKQKAPDDAAKTTDERLDVLQNHFERMVERFQAGEMPWQNK